MLRRNQEAAVAMATDAAGLHLSPLCLCSRSDRGELNKKTKQDTVRRRRRLTTASWWSCKAKVRSTCEGWPGGRRGPTAARAWGPPRSSPPTRTRLGWSLLQRGGGGWGGGGFHINQKQGVARRMSNESNQLDSSENRKWINKYESAWGDSSSLNVED